MYIFLSKGLRPTESLDGTEHDQSGPVTPRPWQTWQGCTIGTWQCVTLSNQSEDLIWHAPNNDFHISKSAFPLHLTELREQRDLLRFLWWACMELDLQLVQPFGPTVYSAWALGRAVGRGDACRAGELEECAQNKGFENQTGHNGKMRKANNGETMQNSLLAWFWAWNCRTNVHSIEYTHLKRWSQAMFALLNWITWNNICNPFLYQLASRLTLVPLRSSHMHVK